MQEEKSSDIGFLKASKARHAEEAIGHSEGLVTVLRLTQADIRPAENALRIAKKFFDAHRYSQALLAAKRAESLAITLDERFNAYQKAVKSLQSRIHSMERLGLTTETLQSVLEDAEEKVLAGIPMNGTLVPNYLEARVLLERAERDGRSWQEKSERASNAIFVAELATEALVEMNGLADPRAFAEGAGKALEHALQDATRELALGNAEAASQIAKDIEAKATRLRAKYSEAAKTLDATKAQLAELLGEGIITANLESQVNVARDTLGKGMIEPGSEMAARLLGEAKALGETYRKATTGLADAEVVYARLERERYRSYEAEAAMRDARRAIREGNYARGIEHLWRAYQAFAVRSNAKEALAKAIKETCARIQLLEGSGLPLLPDIQEVISRAEREFHQGNFTGSSEDLRIATVLLDQATRAPNPKK